MAVLHARQRPRAHGNGLSLADEPISNVGVNPLKNIAEPLRTAFVVAPEAATLHADRKKVLFLRTYRRFRGGHLKAWHYYNHVAASGTHMPYVAFAEGSIWDDTNPWNQPGQRILPQSELHIEPDLYFLAGRDWARIEPSQREQSPVPVINFLQHVRHGDSTKEHHRFLGHRAIRICVDPAVERAIRATGLVRGPIFTIQNGTDLECVEDARWDERELDLVIVGLKRPEIARRLFAIFEERGIHAKLLDTLVPRASLLDDIRRAKATLFLPNDDEGAYLPPMEAMALGSLVICPDHHGTSYCRDGEISFRPPYGDAHVIDAVERALAMKPEERDALLEAGFRTVRSLTLEGERSQFLDILRRVDQLWRQDGA